MRACDLDCGTTKIALVDGTKVHCTVKAKDDPTTYGSVVTISEVSGTKYHVDIVVDKKPQN